MSFPRAPERGGTTPERQGPNASTRSFAADSAQAAESTLRNETCAGLLLPGDPLDFLAELSYPGFLGLELIVQSLKALLPLTLLVPLHEPFHLAQSLIQRQHSRRLGNGT